MLSYKKNRWCSRIRPFLPTSTPYKPTRMSSKQQFMLTRPKVNSIDDIHTMCFLIKWIDGVLGLGLLCGLALVCPVDNLLMDLSGGGSNGWWTRDTGLGRHWILKGRKDPSWNIKQLLIPLYQWLLTWSKWCLPMIWSRSRMASRCQHIEIIWCVCVCYFIEKNRKMKKIGFIIDEQ